MSVSRIPTPLRRPPNTLLGAVQSDACEVAELGLEVVERVDTIAQIDARSDAEFTEAARLSRELERASPQVANLMRLIRQRIERGLEYDAAEDGHRGAIAAAGGEVHVRGHRTVTALRAYFAGGPSGPGKGGSVSEHTKGPWHIHSTGDVFAWRDDQLVFVAYLGHEAHEANATLIAAAPAMLEALEAVMYFWGRDPLAFGDEATINSLAGRFAGVADQCRLARDTAIGAAS